MTGDILDQITSRAIKDHFLALYNLKDRQQVETVTIDMNVGYVTVIRELLPQVDITIDRFHFMQLINRFMDKCRVRIINTFNTSKRGRSKEVLSLETLLEALA